MKPSTKTAVDLLEKMGNADKKVLLVVDNKENELVKSFRNIVFKIFVGGLFESL